MATKHGIAVRRAQAIEKLEAGMTAVVDRLGIRDVPMAAIPRTSRFKDAIQVQQLEVMADWIGLVVERMPTAQAVAAESNKAAEPEAKPAQSKRKG